MREWNKCGNGSMNGKTYSLHIDIHESGIWKGQ